MIHYPLYAQDIEQLGKADPLTLSGGFTNSNILMYNSLTKSTDYQLYISGNANFNVLGIVQVPISFAYTNKQMDATCANPFNRLSLAPQYKWVKTYIGYATMQFSPYTMSGREFMGGGIELTPQGPWRFMAFAGRLQKETPGNEYTEPTLRRMGEGFLVGYNNKRLTVTLNMMKAKDVADSQSYTPADTLFVAPQDNVVGSVAVEVIPFENVTISGEYSVSVLNANYISDTSANEALFDNSGEVHTFHAGRCGISYSLKQGSVGLSYERVDPNYTSLGCYYNTEDFERTTVDFRLAATEKLQIDGNIGFQHDNLAMQDVNTNSQIAFSGNVSLQATEKLNFTLSATNLQNYVHIKDIIQSITQTNEYQNLDTLSYTEMNLSASASANYKIENNKNIPQTISTTFNYQRAMHEQDEYTKYVSNELYNVNTIYTLRHVPSKLTTSLAFNWNNTITPELKTNVYTTTISASCSIGKVRTSSAVGYSIVCSKVNSNILNARISASYLLKKHHNFGLNASCVNNSNSSNKLQLSVNATYSYVFGSKLLRTDGKLKFNTDF